MTVIDFVESTIAGALATHHPYHWIVIAAKWTCIHLAILWASIRSSGWIARIIPKLWGALWRFLVIVFG